MCIMYTYKKLPCVAWLPRLKWGTFGLIYGNKGKLCDHAFFFSCVMRVCVCVDGAVHRKQSQIVMVDLMRSWLIGLFSSHLIADRPQNSVSHYYRQVLTAQSATRFSLLPSQNAVFATYSPRLNQSTMHWYQYFTWTLITPSRTHHILIQRFQMNA